MLRTAFDLLRRFIGEDKAQDAFEYLLVIGGVSVVVILAMVTPVGNTMINAVIDAVCQAIDTAIPGNTTALVC
jgi:Flp pilus assembly pilin Flp